MQEGLAGSGLMCSAGVKSRVEAVPAAAAANGMQPEAACMKQWGSGAAALLDGQSAADAAF
jgi:hypothetical protein